MSRLVALRRALPLPTGRAYTFLVTAVLLYLAANQTQVGWLYVTSALVGGVVLAALLMRPLSGFDGTRTLPTEDLHEDDDISVSLALRGNNTPQLLLTETSPLAPPGANSQAVFVPMLPRGGEVVVEYDVTVYRRGVWTYPPVEVRTRAPFGMFSRRAQVEVPTTALVYPEVRPLQKLQLLDRHPVAQTAASRSGYGSEVLGVRPYRPGDSPRHVHWRSVARTGQLVSKEFAEETQPGLSLVLDRYTPHPTDDKHTPFEWAVKATISVAEYGFRKRYPLHLSADPDGLAVPWGPISWDGLMQYTARVNERYEAALPSLLAGGGLRQFVAVTVAWPDDALVIPLLALKNTGHNLLVILADPATFPDGGSSAEGLAERLRAEEIDVVQLTFGEDWARQIEEPQ